MLPQDLPCIVVIGEESAGKSATLERITMLPVFPKHPCYGTKMPVRVKMVHQRAGPKKCWISFPKETLKWTHMGVEAKQAFYTQVRAARSDTCALHPYRHLGPGLGV